MGSVDQTRALEIDKNVISREKKQFNSVTNIASANPPNPLENPTW